MLQMSEVPFEPFDNQHSIFMRQLECSSKWSQMYYSNALQKMINNYE